MQENRLHIVGVPPSAMHVLLSIIILFPVDSSVFSMTNQNEPSSWNQPEPQIHGACAKGSWTPGMRMEMYA